MNDPAVGETWLIVVNERFEEPLVGTIVKIWQDEVGVRSHYPYEFKQIPSSNPGAAGRDEMICRIAGPEVK